MTLKFKIRTILKIILFGLFSWIFLFALYLLMYYLSAIDYKNVNLSGYVYSSDKVPIKNVVIGIENSKYEGGDGEATLIDRSIIKTNEEGFYSIDLKVTSYVTIYINEKDYNRVRKFFTIKKSNDKIKQNFILSIKK